MTKGIVFVLLILVLFGNLLGCSKELIGVDPGQEEKPEDEVIDPLVGEGYFVAPWGDDDDPGTFEKPWATWGKAFNASVVKPGDTVYFRGGVYYKDLSEGESNWYYPTRSSGGTGYNISRSGTGGYPVVYINYPDEKPILDCSRVEYPGGTKSGYGIRATAIHNVRFKGLTVRNVFSVGPGTTNIGWFVDGTDVVFEECVMHHVHGTGFENEDGIDLYYINCDSHHCIDTLWTHPGEQGTGFSTFNTTSRDGSVYFFGCRAWKCSDQGFSAGSISFVEWNGCWSFKNGALTAGGHGFKLGVPDNFVSLPLQRRVINCIAAFNRQSGYNTNDGGYPAQAMEVYNNIAYHNGYFPEYDDGSGFRLFPTSSSDDEKLKRVYRNNISYDNEGAEINAYSDAPYTHSHNSWDSNVSVSDADFVSVDSTGILGPRQEDGSLPDLDFLKLVEDSDLIDAGVDVKIPYLGEAPDLGAYERK